MLTENKVPKYIKEIVIRMHPVLMEHIGEDGHSLWGYTFRLDAKWKCGYEAQLEKDVAKLIAWAKRQYATAEVIRVDLWQDYFDNLYMARTAHWHNHAYVAITDPAAQVIERILKKK